MSLFLNKDIQYVDTTFTWVVTGSTGPNFAMKATKILLCALPALFAFSQETLSQRLRGFHFNKGRKQIWSLPSDESTRNSSWFFDFEKYGNCARLDVPPFKLPRRFTLCFKQNPDFADIFTSFSMLSTKSGKSAIEDLKANP